MLQNVSKPLLHSIPSQYVSAISDFHPSIITVALPQAVVHDTDHDANETLKLYTELKFSITFFRLKAEEARFDKLVESVPTCITIFTFLLFPCKFMHVNKFSNLALLWKCVFYKQIMISINHVHNYPKKNLQNCVTPSTIISACSLVSRGRRIANEETSGETVTDFVSAGRFVAEPIKFIWSYDFHHKKHFYSVTGDYRTFKHSPCCISAIMNNHSCICGFLRRSSIQQSKLEFRAFSNCKIYL